MSSMKTWQKRLILAAVMFLVYVVSRTALLTKIPIFTDEAIYIRWGQIALQDPQHRFISLEDGKQPLFIWLMLPMLKLFSDPLFAGRLVSVFAGSMTLLAVILLATKLFDEKVGWVTGLIYVISPFFLLYDRLALYDSLTTAILVWSMYLTVILVQTIRLDASLLLGMTIGAGLLTKSSAQFGLILLPVSLVLFDNKRKSNRARFWRWLGFALIATVIALIFQTILRLSPLGYMVKLKNLTFVVSISDFLQNPFLRISGNLSGLGKWLIQYLTLPITLLAAIGLIANLRKKLNSAIYLFLWFSIPFFALAAFGLVLYPRFILFMSIPLIIFSALGLFELTEKLKFIIQKSSFLFPVSCFLFLVWPTFISYQLIFDPLSAAIPKVDREQLFDNWPSGYGIPEAVSLIKDLSMNKAIFVGTEGTFGLTPYALNIYLKDNKNVQIKGYWPISDGMDELIAIARTGKPTYVLFKDTQVPNPSWPIELVVKYQKGRGDVYMSFYQVKN